MVRTTSGVQGRGGIVGPVARLLALAVLASPLIAGAQDRKRFIAPTSESIRSETEEGNGATPSHVIYVTNLSSVQIVVFSYALRQCENVRQSCNPARSNRKIPPGGRAVITRVEQKNPNMGFRYSFSFGWRADSSDVQTMRFLAENGSGIATQRLENYEAAAADRRAPSTGQDLDLTNEEVAALGDKIAQLTAQPDSVVLRVGQMFLARQVRIIARDSLGASLGRVYSLSWRLMPGIISMRADTIVGQEPGLAEITFRLASNPARVAALRVIVVPDSSR